MLSDLKKRYPDSDGKRHFLISEVTHMASGDVCVAEIDLQSQRIARPLQWNHRNWPEDFAGKGLAPGRIVRQKDPKRCYVQVNGLIFEHGSGF